jgi:hypothetical protein
MKLQINLTPKDSLAVHDTSRWWLLICWPGKQQEIAIRISDAQISGAQISGAQISGAQISPDPKDFPQERLRAKVISPEAMA